MFGNNICDQRSEFIDGIIDFYGNLTPFVIIGSISIFIAFFNVQNCKLGFGKIVLNSFNIYLIHHGLLDILGIIQEKIIPGKFNPIYYIPIMTIVVFSLSYVISIIIINIMKYFSERNEIIVYNKF